MRNVETLEEVRLRIKKAKQRFKNRCPIEDKHEVVICEGHKETLESEGYEFLFVSGPKEALGIVWYGFQEIKW